MFDRKEREYDQLIGQNVHLREEDSPALEVGRLGEWGKR